ncbi:MAG: phosphoglycerate kinase [Dehalococcoidia bacterium]|nr:phosphoglycerate kinase [Dehalococcoidia bacterium]
MDKLTVRDVPVRGKRVLVRVDFNVPLDKERGAVTDDTRIKESLPTIRYLMDNGARVVLMSHLGRPDGKVVGSLRMGGVAKRLSELLGKPVRTVADCIGPEVEKAVGQLQAGEVVLLENIRFHAEEEKNDAAFSQALARLGDVFVNDAFGTTHRAHASTVGVTRYLPSVAGLLVEKELKALGQALEEPARPFAALVGGAKISDKMGVVGNILKKLDLLLIGGGMAATFLKVKGLEVGGSLVEVDRIVWAEKMMREAEESRVRLLLPVDFVVSEKPDGSAPSQTVRANAIPARSLVVDIGPETVKSFSAELRKCKTVLWNGPMGIFEVPGFASGTRAMAELLAGLNATTIVGGGSTAEAVVNMGLKDRMTHVSTGGGASLTFLEGETLPGVAALQDKK